MIQTLWTLDITPLQRWIRLQVLGFSSLFPCHQLTSKQEDALRAMDLPCHCK
jgi:hypothetical protein